MSQHRIAVIGSGTGFAPVGGTPPAPILAVATEAFAPELVMTRYSVFPGTPYDRGLGAIGYLDAGVRAAQDGAAAIFINTFGDYGIAELRSALSIPVIGAGETSMAVAATLGQRFAIVTIWPPSLRFLYEERLSASRMNDRCIDVISVLTDDEMRTRGSDDDPVMRMRAGHTPMIDRIVAAAEDAVRRGADTIVLGCTCMAPIAKLIAARLAVPVVDPMTTGYKFAEAMITLGLTQSPVAYPRAAAERLAAVGELVGGGAGVSAIVEDCPVCVVAAE